MQMETRLRQEIGGRFIGVPPEGLKVGGATLGGILMVYIAEAVSLSSIPVFEALALMIRLSLTGIGLAYLADDDEGSVPSMV